MNKAQKRTETLKGMSMYKIITLSHIKNIKERCDDYEYCEVD